MKVLEDSQLADRYSGIQHNTNFLHSCNFGSLSLHVLFQGGGGEGVAEGVAGVQDEEAAEGEAPQEAQEETLDCFKTFGEWHNRIGTENTLNGISEISAISALAICKRKVHWHINVPNVKLSSVCNNHLPSWFKCLINAPYCKIASVENSISSSVSSLS